MRSGLESALRGVKGAPGTRTVRRGLPASPGCSVTLGLALPSLDTGELNANPTLPPGHPPCEIFCLT